MARYVTVGAAQSGPVSRRHTRAEVVECLVEQLREAHARGCDLVVFTECALTAFFPHWFMEDQAEIDAYFESAMPGNATQPLFEAAARRASSSGWKSSTRGAECLAQPELVSPSTVIEKVELVSW